MRPKLFCDLFYLILKNCTTLVSNSWREAFHYYYLQTLWTFWKKVPESFKNSHKYTRLYVLPQPLFGCIGLYRDWKHLSQPTWRGIFHYRHLPSQTYSRFLDIRPMWMSCKSVLRYRSTNSENTFCSDQFL